MAEQGDAAILSRISDYVGDPENPNVSAVVRKRGESDESKALRKAGYGPLQRAALLSPLANALVRSEGLELREAKVDLERQRVGQADERLEQGYDRLEMQKAVNDMRAEREGVRMALDQFKLEQERARNQTATQELTQAANFFKRASTLNPEDPDFMDKILEIEPVVSAETDTGKSVAAFLKDRISKHEMAGQKLLPAINRAVMDGYTGVVLREDNSIDPWASYKALPEWAKAREQEMIAREDSKIATGREFTAAQSDIASLERRKAALEKTMAEVSERNRGPLEQELATINAEMEKARTGRQEATSPAPVRMPGESAPALTQSPAIAAISTREEFDKLPSGATYIRNGKTYRKP